MTGSERIILAIETSHGQGSVALGSARHDPEDPEQSGAVAMERFSPGLVHAREILSRIDDLFRRSGHDRDGLTAVAVSAGPGSYTGIRIGVIQEVLYKRRWHETNRSYKLQFNNSMLKILRRSVQRKRQQVNKDKDQLRTQKPTKDC